MDQETRKRIAAYQNELIPRLRQRRVDVARELSDGLEKRLNIHQQLWMPAAVQQAEQDILMAIEEALVSLKGKLNASPNSNHDYTLGAIARLEVEQAGFKRTVVADLGRVRMRLNAVADAYKAAERGAS